MPALKGVTAAGFIALNTVVLATLLAFVALLRGVMLQGPSRDRLSRFMDRFMDAWVTNNRFMLHVLRITKVDARWHLDAPLERDRWYLVVANHQGWSDILILQDLLLGRIPTLKFFVKRELVWLPFAGAAMWMLNFPFSRRHGAEQRARDPTLAAADRAETLAACRRCERHPTTLLIFVEGTRFTAEKHSSQDSPYRHLLKPKVGGVGHVLDSLGDRLDQVIDVTVLYPGGVPTFWSFLCGRCARVEVDVRGLEVPSTLTATTGPFDTAARAALQDWIGELWQSKDRLIGERRAH